jgi:glutamate-1-semialdehyde aminotransferase
LKLNNSKKLKLLTDHLILVQTLSRPDATFVEDVCPIYAKSALGSHFTDVDGNKSLNYLMELGPITLGYNYKKVNSAITNQLKKKKKKG